MAARKHSVDPSIQPMLFAPSVASVGHGVIVQVEGGGFMPKQEATKLSPEQEATIGRIDAEVQALNHLAAEFRNAGLVTVSARKLRELQNDYHYDENEKYTLLDKYNKDEADAKASIFEHRLASKSQFARSIGIEARRVVKILERNGEPVINEETGRPEQTIVVEAVNEDDRNALDWQYREFRGEYYGRNKHQKLEARRKQLAAHEASIHAVAASTVLS